MDISRHSIFPKAVTSIAVWLSSLLSLCSGYNHMMDIHGTNYAGLNVHIHFAESSSPERAKGKKR